ncbi:Nnf1-domain-containing protein [Westerdykella ornata]|uniref:Nnf1-domain-containing protein n=1 Tax=Westerdykella ornata TaxID=318751 RepID=A0A6A6JFA8_WESOR|nr:Nnf1-domain-containing protein [Westerdykella ornata]KAF2275007.1 Nnf1-domain-containing protein [Westerdykella ornata]
MPSATNPELRSPSPTPAPPIAETPGPRAAGLLKVFDGAVKSTLDKCSPNNFASCFPTIAEYNPDALESIRTQIIDQLDRAWRANFEEILKKRDVVKSLNGLDQCIEDAKRRKKKAEEDANGGPIEVPRAPHTLSPSEIHLAHLMPFLEQQSAAMKTQLDATQKANAELVSTVTSQRAEIETLVRGLESVIHDLETSAQIMGQDDVQGLGAEIRDLETEMSK